MILRKYSQTAVFTIVLSFVSWNSVEAVMDGSTNSSLPLDKKASISQLSQSSSILNMKSSRLLIKLKPNAAKQQRRVARNTSSIDQLNIKHKVKQMKSLYENMEEDGKKDVLITADEQFKKNANKFPKRMKRASKKVSVPNLENIYVVDLQDNQGDIQAIVDEYKKNPNVDYVEPQQFYKTQLVPNDYLFSQQWSLVKTQTLQAWDITTGDPTVVIAVIDTGVDYFHPDLTQNIWKSAIGKFPGYDFVNIKTSDLTSQGFTLISQEDYEYEDNSPLDYNGHGTHCSGIAAAKGNNGIGISGVCHNCKIMPLRAGFSVRYQSVDYGLLDNTAILKSIQYAVDNGADVISMSYGGGASSPAMQEMISYAKAQGVILVAAAGNEMSNQRSYPAAYEGVISVGATDENDQKAWFSNYGSWVTVAAPGTNILSTVPVTGSVGNSSGFQRLSGTSMATPFVAGVVGLMLSKNTTLSIEGIAEKIKIALLQSVDNLPAVEHYVGTGRVNTFKSLQINVLPQLPLEAEISSPIWGNNLGIAGIDIIGTAIGASYVVSYGKGLYPTQWVDVLTRAENKTNATLAHIDLQGQSSGVYMIRLRVFDAQGNYKDKRVPLSYRDANALALIKKKLITDDADIEHFDIFGNHIAMTSSKWVPNSRSPRGYSFEDNNFIYDLIQNTKEKVATHAFAYSIAISNNYVIWGKNQIFAYDRTSKQTKQITNETNTVFYDDLDISGPNIVYSRGGTGATNIWVHRLNNNTRSYLTSGTYMQTRPSIDGNNIIWQDNRNYKDSIFYYLLGSNIDTKRNKTGLFEQASYPDVYGDQMVFIGQVNGRSDIYLYNLKQSTFRKITDIGAIPVRNVRIYGDKIIWEDLRNNLIGDLYLYDLATNKELRITNNPKFDYEVEPYSCEDGRISANWIICKSDEDLILQGTTIKAEKTSLYAFDLAKILALN